VFLRHNLFDEAIIFGVGPRITKSKVMFGFIKKGMLKSELKTFFSLDYSILLDWNSNAIPVGLFFTSKNREMTLFE
jgi:hypothetical protein